jgi:hypothetical protein
MISSLPAAACAARFAPIRSSAAASLLLAVLLFAPAAAGQVTKAQCVAADTQAQELRREEKFGAARAQLKVCVDPACPSLVRDDCSQRLDELDKIQPTIVFDAKDSQGHDLTAVKVTLDGQPLADSLSGAAIPVEPGEHTFTFEAAGEKPLTKQLVLHEGDKARHEPVLFGPPKAAVVVAPPPPSSGSRGAGQRTAGLVLGGLGVVGLGLGGVFGGLAAARWSTAQGDCPNSKSCTPSDNTAANGERSNAVTLAAVSTAGFIAGGVLTASGIIVFLTAPRGGESRPAQGMVVAPEGGPGSASLVLRGWF